MEIIFNMKNKRGFTLAELMIVLTILGVVAAILTPLAFNAAPDENKLRFKKAYYTLQRNTDAVMNSDIYPEGDMSKVTNPAKTFCYAFSDMLNTMYDNCEASSTITVNSGSAFTYDPSNSDTSLDTLDGYCTAKDVNDPLKGGTNNLPKFITQDGIFWWGFDYDFDTTGTKVNNIRVDYSVVCVDVDGQGGENAFAFGIRNDGKVIVGNKAREWLKEGANSVIHTEDE